MKMATTTLLLTLKVREALPISSFIPALAFIRTFTDGSEESGVKGAAVAIKTQKTSRNMANSLLVAISEKFEMMSNVTMVGGGKIMGCKSALILTNIKKGASALMTKMRWNK